MIGRSMIPFLQHPPCLGCAYCCRKAPCVLGEGTPCIELIHRDGRYWCGLVLNAEGEEQEMIKQDLFIGDGCCSTYNSDRREKLVELQEKLKRDHMVARGVE